MVLEGKTIVIAGAGPGLGAEIAKCALRDGANVVLGARNEERLAKLAEQLDPGSERVAYRPTDITDDSNCQGLCREGVARFGGVDGLVQVAALDAIFGSILEAPDEQWQDSFRVNVLGPVKLVRAVAPVLEERGGGSIVLIGSQAFAVPQTPQAAYGAAKGGLNSAMYFMAKELGPHRIRVNTVVPTWMWGPPAQAYAKGEAERRGISEDAVIQEITANFCIPEIPKDDDVAEAVVFLASDRARLITGQHLMVNSGQLMT